MKLNKEEGSLLIEAINHSIAYRLNNSTRMSEVTTLKKIKKEIEKSIASSSETTNEKGNKPL